MYSVYGDGICVYNDLYLSGAINALTPKLDLADNTAGTLEITLPVGNAGYDKLERLSSEIVVKRDNEEIWAGRIISEKKNFQNSRILTCEGELAYLNDTTQSPTEYNEIDVYSFVEALLTEHNSKVADNKQLEMGSITVNETISRITNNETTMESISEHLVDKLGGHIRIRRIYDETGVLHRYFDYLKDYPNTNGQTIRFGQNLLDFTRNWDMSEYATVIMPRGAKLDTSPIESVDAYLDVSSVNGGSRYVTNEDAIKMYGWIELVVDWEDITDPSELLQKAKDYLSDEQFDDVVIEVSAVDLRYLSKDVQSINLLDNVRCISRPHGMDKVFPITKLSIQLDSAENSTYTLGDTAKESSLTASTRAANTAILERIAKIPNEKTILDKARDNATSIMNMATQGYVTIIKNQDGSEYLAVSSENANIAYDPSADEWKTDTKLWKWSINGLAYSKDGGRNFTDAAITMDGAIVANFITTGTMSADRIRTGILESSESHDNWSSTKYYYQGNAVIHNNKTWRAVTYVGKGKEPGVTVWSETTTTTGATDWSYSTAYTKGDIVKYDDKYWVALVANTNYYPGETYWIQINKKNVVFDLNNGSLSILSGSISLGIDANGSYKFQVDDSGYLTAEYGKIGGFTISAWSIYNDTIHLNSGGMSFYKDNNLLGNYGTQYWVKKPEVKGLSVSMENGTGYITWGYKDTASADSYTIKLMYNSTDLPDNDGGTFVGDRIHLGTYMQLDHYGFSFNYQVEEYTSFTVVKKSITGELTDYPRKLELPFNLKRNGNSLNWEYVECYICNGVIMTRLT